MITVVKETPNDGFHVWVCLNEDHKPGDSETFIIGSGPTRHRAVLAAAMELQHVKERLMNEELS